jgi:hypothetical protein
MASPVSHLADRVRDLLGNPPGLAEKKMFGAIAFMLDGNMLVAPMKDGSLLVRTGKDGQEAALARPGAAPMAMRGRAMGGFVTVDAAEVEDDEALAGWIATAQAFVRGLPPK